MTHDSLQRISYSRGIVRPLRIGQEEEQISQTLLEQPSKVRGEEKIRTSWSVSKEGKKSGQPKLTKKVQPNTRYALEVEGEAKRSADY